LLCDRGCPDGCSKVLFVHAYGCQGALSCVAIEGALMVALRCNLFMLMGQGALSCFAIEGTRTVTLFYIVHLIRYNLFLGVRVPSLALQ
jgi:hypothetical protein